MNIVKITILKQEFTCCSSNNVQQILTKFRLGYRIYNIFSKEFERMLRKAVGLVKW